MYFKKSSENHTTPSINKEVQLIAATLVESKVLHNREKRSHQSFNFKKTLLEEFDRDKLCDWLVNTVGTHAYIAR